MAVPDALSQPIALDLFEGPFDLLLTLVLREEVDLLELPLLQVVSAALGDHAEERWDTNTAGELIVLLAAMAELKSKLLLGEETDEEPDPDALEAREMLATRLVAYAPFQRAAHWLRERAVAGAGPRYRRVPLPDRPPPDERLDPRLLRAALAALLIDPPEVSLTHIHRRRINIPQVLARLRDALARARTISFDELVLDTDRLAEAVTFMAVLELARRGEATLAQPEPFGDIAITRAR
ncbi:MAG TPA: ScpA family protein [Miltoncostaeaceae bacterium]|nr:ScpA family protein [Miltoncostaeaceae bacterium]